MKTKDFKQTDLVIIIAVTAVLSVVLLPVFTHVRVMQSSRCQSNMNRIGQAIRMYLADWQDMYPTQRLYAPYNTFIASQVNLTRPNLVGPGNEPVRYENGCNWVEALYPYIERARYDNQPSVWKCPAAKNVIQGGANAAVTYSFNANLIEKPKQAVRHPNITMMCRELDRLYNAVLKPVSQTPSNSPAPSNVFLNLDPVTGCKPKLHEEGSHILFADGHVKYFPLAYYPTVCAWDATNKQWFNYVDNIPVGDLRRRSIAVTP